MGGGLLNLLSYGSSNIIVFGNPKKSLFKASYKSITNFGMQRFRLDSTTNNVFSFQNETVLDFPIKRHADMISDVYLVVNIPDIWSPMYTYISDTTDTSTTHWYSTEFKWIEELGTTMIKEVEIYSGSQVLGKYPGEYFAAVLHRDNTHKKELWNKMTGNTVDMYDPANAYDRKGTYPTAIYPSAIENHTLEPSIRGKKLYIPLNVFFSRDSSVALPLVALQYSLINIKIRLRPLKELYRIYSAEKDDHISPNSNFQINTFLHQPTNESQRHNETVTFNYDTHIIATYYFLSEDENKKFAREPHNYLVKDVYKHTYTGIVGASTQRLDTKGLISSFMFYFRRSDAYTRNDWTNYTNWSNQKCPYGKVTKQNSGFDDVDISGNIYTSGKQKQNAEMHILKNMQLVLDGKARENELDQGIYQFIEPYARSHANNKDGLYHYNFCTHTDVQVYQPYGGMNMDKFSTIDLKMTVLTPHIKETITYQDLCFDGEIVGTRKQISDVFEYTYDLVVFEERYNVVSIQTGIIGMLYAR